LVALATVTAPETIGLLAWWAIVLAAPVIFVRRWRRRAAPRRARRPRLLWRSVRGRVRRAPGQVAEPAARQPGPSATRFDGDGAQAETHSGVLGSLPAQRSVLASAGTSRIWQTIRRSPAPAARLAPQTLGPLCRYVDFRRRLAVAAAQLEATLRQLPCAGWRVEPYPLTGERGNSFLVLGETGIFVLSATFAPGHWDDVITVSRLAGKIQELLPGYDGHVHPAICHPFSSTEPRIWHRADEHGDWVGAWVLGGDCVLQWLAHFGTRYGLNAVDLARFDGLVKPDWLTERSRARRAGRRSTAPVRTRCGGRARCRSPDATLTGRPVRAAADESARGPAGSGVSRRGAARRLGSRVARSRRRVCARRRTVRRTRARWR
jgi:hypothetical protein